MADKIIVKRGATITIEGDCILGEGSLIEGTLIVNNGNVTVKSGAVIRGTWTYVKEGDSIPQENGEPSYPSSGEHIRRDGNVLVNDGSATLEAGSKVEYGRISVKRGNLIVDGAEIMHTSIIGAVDERIPIDDGREPMRHEDYVCRTIIKAANFVGKKDDAPILFASRSLDIAEGVVLPEGVSIRGTMGINAPHTDLPAHSEAQAVYGKAVLRDITKDSYAFGETMRVRDIHAGGRVQVYCKQQFYGIPTAAIAKLEARKVSGEVIQAYEATIGEIADGAEVSAANTLFVTKVSGGKITGMVLSTFAESLAPVFDDLVGKRPNGHPTDRKYPTLKVTAGSISDARIDHVFSVYAPGGKIERTSITAYDFVGAREIKNALISATTEVAKIAGKTTLIRPPTDEEKTYLQNLLNIQAQAATEKKGSTLTEAEMQAISVEISRDFSDRLQKTVGPSAPEAANIRTETFLKIEADHMSGVFAHFPAHTIVKYEIDGGRIYYGGRVEAAMITGKATIDAHQVRANVVESSVTLEVPENGRSIRATRDVSGRNPGK